MSNLQSIEQTFKCKQDFDAMTSHGKDAFCTQCATPIVDFVSMSEIEIIDYLEKIKESSLCARLSEDQLNKVNEILAQKNRGVNFKAVYPLLFALMIGLSSCGSQKDVIDRCSQPVQPKTNNVNTIEVVKEIPQSDSLVFTIYGQVVCTDYSEGLPFVNITISTLDTGVVSDVEGRFTMQVEKSKISSIKESDLEIHYLGYESRRIPLEKVVNNEIRISLDEDPILLGHAIMIVQPPLHKRIWNSIISFF